MSKHTRGPWNYCSEPETEPYEFYVQESWSGWDHPVAHVRFNTPDSEGNARLISAAPDLLEALEGLRKHYDSFYGPLWDKAEEAIRKARTETV